MFLMVQNILFDGCLTDSYYAHVVVFLPEMSVPILRLQICIPVEKHSAFFPLKYPMISDRLYFDSILINN